MFENCEELELSKVQVDLIGRDIRSQVLVYDNSM